LREGWVRVQRNKGAAGVDKQTVAAVQEYGVERLLGELQRDLRSGSYRPTIVTNIRGGDAQREHTAVVLAVDGEDGAAR
jgi:hypothetical protein